MRLKGPQGGKYDFLTFRISMTIRLNNLVKFPSWAYKRFGNPMSFRFMPDRPWHVETIIAQKLKESVIVSMMPPVAAKFGMDITLNGVDEGKYYEFVNEQAQLQIIQILDWEFRDELHQTLDLMMQQGGLIEQQAIMRFCQYYDIDINNDEAFHKDYYRWRYRDNRRIYIEQAAKYFEQ